MNTAKKELQKVVKAWRDSFSKDEYPKAMMGSAQMAKKTATVNCSSQSDEEIKEVIKALESFCKNNSAIVAGIELVSGTKHCKQIRLLFAE